MVGMPSAEQCSQRCELRATGNLLAALNEQLIEHLPVDDARTFVCYREAVIDLRVTEGTLAAARAFTVASQGFAYSVRDPDPGAVITALCREIVAATDTDRC